MSKTKLKWTYITATNVCIQWALEYDNPKTALYELSDSAIILKNILPKDQLNFKFL